MVTGLYPELYRPGWAVGLGEAEVLLGWFPLCSWNSVPSCPAPLMRPQKAWDKMQHLLRDPLESSSDNQCLNRA